MISTKRAMPLVAVGTTSIILVLSVVSFVGVSTTEIFAVHVWEGTDTTNVTATVVMPAGSLLATQEPYEPRVVTVAPGDTVVWENQDDVPHTATSGQSPNPDGLFDTGVLSANHQSKPVTIPGETNPGEYPYFCTLHPFLTGTVVVQK